ncbi:MAG: hypothetical protein ACFFCQ_03110 [Promethearchaeota archaeon]
MVTGTKIIPYEELRKQVTKADKIGLISCNTCVREYETGGVEYMNELAAQFEAEGYSVVDKIIATVACIEDYFQLAPKKEDVTAYIVLACGAGWVAVRRNTDVKKVIQGIKTIGIPIKSKYLKVMMPEA